MKKEVVALDGDDAYFGEADYGFENNYDSYSYAGRGSGYSYGEGGLEEEERVGDRPPSLTLPTTILAVQPLGSGLALLDEVRPLFSIQL